MKKVIFSDRDGVINRDSPDYIKNWSEFEFLPGSIEAIRYLTVHGFNTIVITNQSMINRKISSEKDLRYMHSMMKKAVISAGGEIRDIFFCPHAPDEECDCRKPKPGLIYQAQQAHQIDLKHACMIGDSAKDIECGRNAGCGRVVLVRTGNGIAAEKILTEKNIVPDHIAENLYEAAQWIGSSSST